MFDLGIGEILVIGVVALIFVGPKDFTKMFREIGRFTAKLRKMARDFQRAMEDAADESGMRETASNLKKMTSAKELGLDAVKDAAKGWDNRKSSVAKGDKPKDDAPKGTEKAGPTPREVGPETAKLSEERAAQAKKIHEYSAKKTQERLDAEKAAAAAEAEAGNAKPKRAKRADPKPDAEASKTGETT